MLDEIFGPNSVDTFKTTGILGIFFGVLLLMAWRAFNQLLPIHVEKKKKELGVLEATISTLDTIRQHCEESLIIGRKSQRRQIAMRHDVLNLSDAAKELAPTPEIRKRMEDHLGKGNE